MHKTLKYSPWSRYRKYSTAATKLSKEFWIRKWRLELLPKNSGEDFRSSI